MSMSGQLWRCVSHVERDSAAMNACVHALQEFDRVEAQLQAAQQAILQQPSFEEVTALAADLAGARQQAETSQEMVEPASSRPIPERFPLAASQKLGCSTCFLQQAVIVPHSSSAPQVHRWCVCIILLGKVR